MKKCFYFIVFMFISFSGFSQNNLGNYWLDVQKPSTIKQNNPAPINARSLKLDHSALEKQLKTLRDAPSGKKINLEIPLPNSGSERFEVEFFPIMSPALSKKFPDIHSYRGMSMDNPDRTIAFGFTPKGFHAQILGERTIIIDPISKTEQSDYYQAYFKDETPFNQNLLCEFENKAPFKDMIDPNGNTSRAPLGDCQIRTFRLAVACTGEYAQYHGGTVNSAMAAINVTMTRVNGIYNRELAVHMILVDDNDNIIFLNGNSDPYTNNNGFTMLTENQTTIDNEIGNGNYDIGHVFSTGGGGIATLNSPCVNGSKARGVTGLADPIGDVFDVDYVSHEMGHQFGANHTQNNNCQRNNPTAIEPGSASTIMGYAGICAPNVQLNSDDYFHTISIEEMYNNIISGSSTCGDVINSSNSNPTANAGINRTIPRQTPFFLTGEASDASLFSWEQIDNEVGAAMPPLANNPVGPMFRSIQPLTTPTRFLPNLPSVLNNTTETWEVLPSTGRTMDFAFTVRDNRFGWGCSAVDNMRVTTAAQSGPFTVTSQTSNEMWATGTTQTITWNVANSNAAPVNCSNVDILLSTDGGFTWDIVLINGTANDGTQDIVVPNQLTSNGRIIVRCSDNIFYNVSLETISITPPPCDTTDSSNFEMNVICENGTWKVSTQALDLDPQNHWWGLYQTDTQGEVSDTNTIAGPIGGIQNGETANFNWLDQSKRYYIKHGIWTEDCYTWRETRIPIEPFYVEPADFHFENENNEAQDIFCVGEDIWADGNATIGEDRYNIHAWRLVNGQKQWFGSIGWFFGNMTEVNISDEFADLANPLYFNPGKYVLTIAFSNPSECEVWTPIEKAFEVVCCEDEAFDPSFVVDVSEGNIYTVNGFDPYSNHDVEHQWFVFSSTDNTLSQDDTFVASGSGTSFSHTAADSDLFYIFVHKIITECGEVCFVVAQYQNLVTTIEENRSRALFDCSILDEFCIVTTPTDLTYIENTLSWDPVPGAVGYSVENANFWPAEGCKCENPVSILPFSTMETSAEIDLNKGSCAVVQVRARCADGTMSEPSRWICIGGKGRPKTFEKATISPNPTRGLMTFDVVTSYDTKVTVEVYSFHGNLIKSFVSEVTSEQGYTVSWDGRGLVSGVYFVKFITDEEIVSKKVIIY